MGRGLHPTPDLPLPGSYLTLLLADAQAAPAKDIVVSVPVLVPEKVASSRSTQTPVEQLEPPTTGPPPTTPPPEHKEEVQKADGAVQGDVPPGVLQPPALREEGPRLDPNLPPDITVCVPPELMFTPPRTVDALPGVSLPTPHVGDVSAFLCCRGRFGVIRLCKENATGKHFMAKIVPYETERKQSVLQEYEILKALHHERIMALHEAYITPRYLVLICENCGCQGWLPAQGHLLMPLVPRFRYSEDDVVNYVLQLLQGLEYLHSRRIVHLDIKPDNVVVSGMNALKIIDFGSAQTYNPLVLRQLGRRVGTLEYMCEWGTREVVAWGWGWGQGQIWGTLVPEVCMCTCALRVLGMGRS
uniref:Protein kinase domain-containing protein n=1 Tax=Athene cunicularia TaxID=194338 RepID=A0A663MW34_ATHCN